MLAGALLYCCPAMTFGSSAVRFLTITGGLVWSQPPQIVSRVVVNHDGTLPLELYLVQCMPGGAAGFLLVFAEGLVWYQPLPPLVVIWLGVLRLPVVGLLYLVFLFAVARALVGSQPPSLYLGSPLSAMYCYWSLSLRRVWPSMLLPY